jgi:transitional endoplasmic reticulum ATPase
MKYDASLLISLFYLSRSQLLQKLYPNHSLVVTQDYRLNILSFPDLHAQPISPSELITNTVFASLPKHASPVPGILLDSVEYGAFKAFWQVSFSPALFGFNTLIM